MKNTKRSLRRWKTKVKRNTRAKRLATQGYYRYGIIRGGKWVPNVSVDERVRHIKKYQYGILEDPQIHSDKDDWGDKGNRSKMRNKVREDIREYRKEEFEEFAEDLLGKIFGKTDPYRD